jgi:general secretion pathway protein I
MTPGGPSPNRAARESKRIGFTLLEVLVATVIMAIAVTGLLSSLSTSLRNAARLSDADRSAMLAKQKMDELLLETRLPRGLAFEGTWDPVFTGGQPAGWRALVTPFEFAPGSGPGAEALERVQLEVWFGPQERRRRFALEGFRRGQIRPPGGAPGMAQ